MRAIDRISGLVCLAFAVAMIIASSEYEFGRPSNPGPGFLPVLSLSVLGVLSVALFVRSLLAENDGSQLQERFVRGISLKRSLAAVLAIFAYAFVLDVLGFLATTFVFLLFIMRGIGGARWHLALGGALLTTGLTHLVFGILLRIPLPKGIWVGVF